ncbi:Glucose-1-phosphate adenylyltransferase [Saliniradius amylolyticus]|uniref:Glucose-1-phosphate adenylyltransferase n=1 Tax=Saliniradius amylolyticus TaxID=2183582 RepID=A0A2S2E0J5_9ALTE|nr:glucose-1-phosphate adenylyltransferase [Saliniradius amylolyticus]AWL10810.1 Glucose-1-phosphate adenylyltransferase [Saliniradius amylolyticus]
MSRTLAMIMAGGAGTRLYPLTQTRTKPAVPFAGGLRLIDFVLNNFVNSDLLKIYVLTQFKSQSLNIHLRQAWYLSGLTGNFIDAIPAQMRMGKRWYEGTADAIYQNLRLIEIHEPDNVCIFGSDHIYKMEVRQAVRYHEKKQADLTVCATRVPLAEASRFGVIEVDENFRMIGFEEKPANPKPLPDDPNSALVSMGNYIFDTQVLFDTLHKDAEDKLSSHDFGNDIIPKLYPKGSVYVYDFTLNQIPGEEGRSHYWRDVGTLYSFWEAHMDLLSCSPPLDLTNPKWPLRSYHPPVAPARILGDNDGTQSAISDSMIAAGCTIVGANVERSVLGYKIDVGAGASLKESIFLGTSTIGAGCELNRVVADKGVTIAPGTRIGIDNAEDRDRGLTVTDEGLVVLSKGAYVGN